MHICNERFFKRLKICNKLCISLLTRNLLCIIMNKEDYFMKSYSSREVLKMLKADGWYEVACDGDHLQLKHPIKSGRVTLTHPKKDIPQGTLRSISKQSGITFR